MTFINNGGWGLGARLGTATNTGGQQFQMYATGGKDSRGTAYVPIAAPAPAPTPAAEPAPAPAAAPTAAPTPAPAAPAPSAATTASSPGPESYGASDDTARTPGELDKYLASSTDYDKWLSNLSKKEEGKDDDDGKYDYSKFLGQGSSAAANNQGWDRYIEKPLPTNAKEDRWGRTRMAGGGDFTSALRNYS